MTACCEAARRIQREDTTLIGYECPEHGWAVSARDLEEEADQLEADWDAFLSERTRKELGETDENPVPTPGSKWYVEFRRPGKGWSQPHDKRTITVLRIEGDEVIVTGSWDPEAEEKRLQSSAFTEGGGPYRNEMYDYDGARAIKQATR